MPDPHVFHGLITLATGLFCLNFVIFLVKFQRTKRLTQIPTEALTREQIEELSLNLCELLPTWYWRSAWALVPNLLVLVGWAGTDTLHPAFIALAIITPVVFFGFSWWFLAWLEQQRVTRLT